MCINTLLQHSYLFQHLVEYFSKNNSSSLGHIKEVMNEVKQFGNTDQRKHLQNLTYLYKNDTYE